MTYKKWSITAVCFLSISVIFFGVIIYLDRTLPTAEEYLRYVYGDDLYVDENGDLFFNHNHKVFDDDGTPGIISPLCYSYNYPIKRSRKFKYSDYYKYTELGTDAIHNDYGVELKVDRIEGDKIYFIACNNSDVTVYCALWPETDINIRGKWYRNHRMIEESYGLTGNPYVTLQPGESREYSKYLNYAGHKIDDEWAEYWAYIQDGAANPNRFGLDSPYDFGFPPGRYRAYLDVRYNPDGGSAEDNYFIITEDFYLWKDRSNRH